MTNFFELAKIGLWESIVGGFGMATVFDFANFFIDLANKTDDDYITNLKLNKLLYFAQGVSLARTNNPLFQEAIEAWKFGQ